MDLSGAWLPPALLGVGLIVLGVLVFVMPQLLAYLVAGGFILGGVCLLGLASMMRVRVVLRRVGPQDA